MNEGNAGFHGPEDTREGAAIGFESFAEYAGDTRKWSELTEREQMAWRIAESQMSLANHDRA